METPSMFNLVGLGQESPHIFENKNVESIFVMIRVKSKEEDNLHDVIVSHFVNIDSLTKSTREQIRFELQKIQEAKK